MTIRDLVDIVRVLKDGSFQTIKWFDLGLYLGLIHNDLKVIETNYPRDAERCLRECLAKWLKDDIEATWDKLAFAVGEVGETSVPTFATSISKIIISTTQVLKEKLATDYIISQLSLTPATWNLKNVANVTDDIL